LELQMAFFDDILDVGEALFDGVVGAVSSAADYVAENPGKCAFVALTAVATGGTALAAAGPIAATLGTAGLLGNCATTGTAIATLGGAALESASLAAIGGGAIAAQGGGMAVGTAVVATAGSAIGGTGATVVAIR
jgi:hypothetical protein